MKNKAKKRNRSSGQIGSVNGAARTAMNFYRGRSAGGKTNKSGKIYDHLNIWLGNYKEPNYSKEKDHGLEIDAGKRR
jgi:hypothetical protein